MNGRPIIFGPGDKLRWLERVASHDATTDVDTRFAVIIMSRLDKFKGSALVAQISVATLIHCGVRTLYDSSRRLERLGLLRIQRSRGKGYANIYWPIKPPDDWRLAADQTKHDQRLAAGQNDDDRQIAAVRPADCSTLTGGQPPPLPNTTKSYLSAPQQSASSEAETAWNSIRGWLANEIGPDKCRSWFETVTAESITDDELVLRGQRKFQTDTIAGQFYGPVLRAAQAYRPSIQRVRVLPPDDPSARPAR